MDERHAREREEDRAIAKETREYQQKSLDALTLSNYALAKLLGGHR